LDLTGTFKLKKIVMQQEGYNPNVIQDQMFFLDAVKGAYRQLDKCLYNDIIEMRCRLWREKIINATAIHLDQIAKTRQKLDSKIRETDSLYLFLWQFDKLWK